MDALREEARQAFARVEPIEDEARLKAEVAGFGYYRYLIPQEYGGVFPKVSVKSICILREELDERASEESEDHSAPDHEADGQKEPAPHRRLGLIRAATAERLTDEHADRLRYRPAGHERHA